jgi:hypothetical protein
VAFKIAHFVNEEYEDDIYKEIYLSFLNLLEEFINLQNGRNVTKIDGISKNIRVSSTC